jgi:sulfite exporter TauE/SafE
MTPLEFSVVFSLGLVSGLHCLQMCGPIVLTYSLAVPKQQALRAHLSYNAGRILTYMFLGALAGVAGGGIGVLGRMAGLASGAAMVVAGILMVGFLPSRGLTQIERKGIGARFSRLAGRLLLTARSKFTLGLVLGFLPCGLVYAALLKAMESAGPLSGAVTMMAFGLGTAIALLAVGMVSTFAGARLGFWSNRLAAISIMAAGAILLWRGVAASHCHG